MLEQNSVNWLEWRKAGLGASDIPILLGISKYKTRHQLYQEKTGEIEEKKDANNYIQETGHIIESEARKIYEIMIGDVCPPLCIQHIQYPWAKASLDGLDRKNNLVWECKMVGQKQFEAKEIDPKFYAQIQWQLFVSGKEKAILFLCIHEKRKLKDFRKVDVLIDHDFIMDIFIKAKEFWDMVENRKYIGEVPQEITDSKLIRLFHEYDELKKKFTEVENQLKEIEKEILTNTVHNDYYAGFRIVETTRKGSVDYKLIDELKHIDLDKFRKPDTKYKTIKRDGEK